MIVGPGGDLLADAPTDKETLVMAQLDLSSLVELRQHHDMAGYYNRHELFQLKLRRERPMLLDAADVFEADAARSLDTASIGMAAE
jgi:aliphatic nitrilase